MDALDFQLRFLENVASFAFIDGSVTTSKLANDAVTGAKILDGTITAAEIANSTITEAKLAFSPASTGKAIAMAIVFGG